MNSISKHAPVRLANAIRRAAGINMKLKDVLERGDVGGASLSTIYRWANGTVDPRLSTYEQTMSAIERTIAAEEAKLLMKLSEIASG